jgi:hypothetical protein
LDKQAERLLRDMERSGINSAGWSTESCRYTSVACGVEGGAFGDGGKFEQWFGGGEGVYKVSDVDHLDPCEAFCLKLSRYERRSFMAAFGS